MTKYFIETSEEFPDEKTARAYAKIDNTYNKINLIINNHAETPKEENKPCEIIKLK